jgi:hypothetical protein
MDPPASTLWRTMFLAEKYGRMTTTLEEVAEQLGMAPNTIRNHRARGEFQWFRTDGRTLSADVADVAAYIARQQQDIAAGAHDMSATAVISEPGEFLTPAELRDLTQRARKQDQVRELGALGIPHLLQRGRILVSRVHVRARLQQKVVRKPDFSKVK